MMNTITYLLILSLVMQKIFACAPNCTFTCPQGSSLDTNTNKCVVIKTSVGGTGTGIGGVGTGIGGSSTNGTAGSGVGMGGLGIGLGGNNPLGTGGTGRNRSGRCQSSWHGRHR
jgi:hypothetical protein